MARAESSRVLPSCPCPSVTAYWRPPPSWPRRLLCEIPCKLLQLLPCCGQVYRPSNDACALVAGAILLTYFVVMDILMFARFRHTSFAEDAGTAGTEGELYSPFTHLTVKAILSDHPRHYLFTPSTELFNSLTGFTRRLPFVSANAVSATHLFCAFLAGKFVASKNLSDRRIGVGIFFFRTWLDSLDGIVYRAHAGRHLQYNSGYSSIGYFVDGLVDTLGGYFLSFGVLFYLWKRFGVLPPIMSPSPRSSPSSTRSLPSPTPEKDSLPLWTKSNLKSPSPFSSSLLDESTTGFCNGVSGDGADVALLNGDSNSSECGGGSPHKSIPRKASRIRHDGCGTAEGVTVRWGHVTTSFSRTHLFLRVLAYGVALLVAGLSWDRAVKMYTELFQVQLSDSALSMLQFELSHSTATIAIFFVWRFISGQTLLTYMQLAIFADRIWEYLQYAPWVFLVITLPLYGLSVSHANYIRGQLHL